mmetsp:Transcript_622/g.2033  ORF Transcript_622/g.2033 Transcript_622/m.2033 type:complete len:217 (+) Transcript_622:2591-3241(+)
MAAPGAYIVGAGGGMSSLSSKRPSSSSSRWSRAPSSLDTSSNTWKCAVTPSISCFSPSLKRCFASRPSLRSMRRMNLAHCSLHTCEALSDTAANVLPIMAMSKLIMRTLDMTEKQMKNVLTSPALEWRRKASYSRSPRVNLNSVIMVIVRLLKSPLTSPMSSLYHSSVTSRVNACEKESRKTRYTAANLTTSAPSMRTTITTRCPTGSTPRVKYKM